MSPGDCGAGQLPPDGTPDREEVDRFRDFLREVDQRGVAAVAADPAWRDYIEADQGRCAVCGAPAVVEYQHDEVRPAVFVSWVASRECSADRTHRGGTSLLERQPDLGGGTDLDCSDPNCDCGK